MNLLALRKSIHWWILFGFLLITIVFYFNGLFPKWSLKYPTEWRIPLRFWISDFMHWLVSDTPSAINFTSVTFKEITRFFTAVLTYPFDFAVDLLSTGFRFEPGDGGKPRVPEWHVKMKNF